MSYQRRTIEIEYHADVARVLQCLAAVPDLVVVNVGVPGEEIPPLFCEENLRTILAAAPHELLIEAMPVGEYKELVRVKVGRGIQLLLALRAGLRTSYVADLTAQVGEFLRELEELLLMMGCWNLRQARPDVNKEVGRLDTLRGQLAASAFELGDNVRCMDDLQYQILPVLESLSKAFKPHRPQP